MKGMTRRELRAARARREAELASGAIPQVDPDASTPAPEPQAPEEGSSRRGRRSMLRPWGSPSAGAAAPPQAPPQAPGADSSATGVIPPPPPGSPTGSPPPADPTDTSELSPWQPESSQPTAPPKRRGVGFTIAIGIVVLVVAGVVWAVLRLSGTEPDPGATAAPSSTATATDAAGQTPLLTMLPSEVEGGANSEDPGPSGVIYSLSPPGWAPDPNEPEAALESYAGIFTGGEEPVTLTASRFGSAADAEAFATELAGTRGTVIDEGYAFAADQRGHYWIFNNDGLVSIIWFDGELGAYSVVAESSEAALDFYHGLTF